MYAIDIEGDGKKEVKSQDNEAYAIDRSISQQPICGQNTFSSTNL